MDAEFKILIISDHERMDSKIKQKFLWLLKFHPDALLIIFSSHFYIWSLNAMHKLHKHIYCDFDDDPPELLEEFREHFSSELEAIT